MVRAKKLYMFVSGYMAKKNYSVGRNKFFILKICFIYISYVASRE